MSAGPRPSDRFIPWYIGLFFMLQAVFFAWLYHIASATYTGLVTDKAYEKGLQYNKVIARYETQTRLGWTSKIVQKEGGLQLMLKDSAGKPLSGAKVRLWLSRPVHGGSDQQTDMKEIAPGYYFSPLSLPEKGLWEARIAVKKKGLSYQTSRRMEF